MEKVYQQIKDRDPRPADLKPLVSQHREVEPVELVVPVEKGSSFELSRKSGLAVARTQAGLTPYSGVWEAPQIKHLLRRTLFGIRKSDFDTFRFLSASQAVDRLLQPSAAPPPPLNYYNEEGKEDPQVAFGETWIHAAYDNEFEGLKISSLKSWLIKNIINQESTLSEKMLLFWHNLLPTQAWGVFIAKTSYQYFEMLRRNSFGNFKTMIRELTLDPAMLVYLNGTRNQKEAPDENYSRELQELFCIGKGPDSGYTESDVQAAARILTGYVINWEQVNSEGPVSYRFREQRHDTSDKQFSSFYGNRVIAGRAGEEGMQELDELLDMIFENNETAMYLSRRLYQFFVYSEIDEAAEQNVITPLADIIRTNNYEVLPALETLLKSEHFFDVVNHGALIKSPLDHLLGLWRTLGVQNPDPTNPVLDYRMHRSMIWNMANKGLEVADPPSVSGWPAYYQAPQFDKAWITTDTIASRATTSDSLVFWGFWVSREVQIPADLLSFVSTLDQPEDPNQLLVELSDLFLGIPLGTSEIDQLKTILLSGQREDHYWSDAWRDFAGDPNNAEYRSIVESRVKSLFQRLLQRGEFQLS